MTTTYPEQALIGAILIRGSTAISEAEDAGLHHGHFAHLASRLIWDAAARVHAAGARIDPVTVAAALGDDLTRAGGPVALTEAYGACPSPASAGIYAGLIVTAATRRGLDAAGRRITALGSPDNPMPVLDALRAAQGFLADAETVMTGTTTVPTMDEAVTDLLASLTVDDTPPITTGLASLDHVLHGGLRGLVTIAARPGVGKTALALEIALRAAMAGTPVGYTSLEMPRRELLWRMTANLARVDLGRIIRAPKDGLTRSEHLAVIGATETLRALPMTIPDVSVVTAATVRASLKDLTRRHQQRGLWIVDYVQLVTGDKTQSREQQVAETTRIIKQATLETDSPVIILAQLNREVERGDRGPRLSDLRESGAIEQDSDVVVLLSREAEGAPHVMACKVAKNRRGPVASCALAFSGSYQRISEQ